MIGYILPENMYHNQYSLKNIAANKVILERRHAVLIHYIFRFTMIMMIILPFYLLFRKPWEKDRKREWALGIFILSTLMAIQH